MDEKGGQRTIKATEFKAKCLRLMDEVSNGGGEIVITKRGVPVARLTPYQDKPAPSRKKRPKTLFGIHKDRYPWLQEVNEALKRGEHMKIVWVTEPGLLGDEPDSMDREPNSMDREPC